MCVEKKTITQPVTKVWLEDKITELNAWLKAHNKVNHFGYAGKLQSRNYYVTKLCELDVSGLDTIEV